MTAPDRADLVLAFARTLYVNGQATEQMMDAAQRLGRALGLRITIIPRWGELEFSPTATMPRSPSGPRLLQRASK